MIVVYLEEVEYLLRHRQTVKNISVSIIPLCTAGHL